jgi:hypothetical protein
MLQKGKYFILGVILMALASSSVVPAVASVFERQITVQSGVNVFVDDVRLNPTDERGNPVEVFIFNGTTYLPVRAVAQAFDTTITWDGRTRSVYIGKHDSDRPALYLQDLDWFTGQNLHVIPSSRDNLGNARTNVLASSRENRSLAFSNVYRINGLYSRIDGHLFQLHEHRNGARVSTLNIYGDGRLLYTAEMRGAMEPIYFNVDISGVLELRVEFGQENRNRTFMSHSRLSNVGLWT